MIFVAGIVFLIVVVGLIIFDRRWHISGPSDFLRGRSSKTSQTSKALVLFSKAGPYTVVHKWPKPTANATELLIKVQAIGLNPIDWKCVAYGFGIHSVPWISGREGSGIVEEIGSKSGGGFKKGDRVFFTSTNYRDNRTSAFQEYVVAASFNVGRLPDWMTFEEGATLGVGSVAAAEALFQGLRIPLLEDGRRLLSPVPNTPQLEDERPWVLVWGGSCVTGIMATQLAKQNGHRVFAVASLHNASYLESLGADKVVDRHHPQDAIAEAQRLQIRLGVDFVGQQTATWALQALQPAGTLVYLVKGPNKAAVSASSVEVTNVLIKRFHEDAGYGEFLMSYISSSLAARTIRPVRHERISGGLEVLDKGLENLKSETVSGKKLVVTVDES